MSLDLVQAMGTWFSGLVIAASLVFIWRQTRQTFQQTLLGRQHALIAEQRNLLAQLSNYHNLYVMWFNVDRIFIEHPDLRPYFYGYQQTERLEKTNGIKMKLDAVSHMMLDCFDDVYHHMDHLPPNTADAWKIFMSDMYRHNAYIRNFIEANQQWYSEHFIRFLKSSIRRD